MSVKPGVLFRSPQAPVVYRERFTPGTANLQFLTCGEFEIEPGAASRPFGYADEEALVARAVHIVRQARVVSFLKRDAGKLLGRFNSLDQHCHSIKGKLRNKIWAEGHQHVVGQIERGKRGE